MDYLKQTIQDLKDEKKKWLRRLNEIDMKMRELVAEEAKLKNVQEKESTASTSSDHNRERCPLIPAPSTTFRDPFLFISELYDSIQEDEKLVNDTDKVIGDFFNHQLSENDLLEKMNLLLLNKPNLISALKTFLATPAAVSRARKNFHEASHIMFQVASRLGRDSQQYYEFVRILETATKKQSETHFLDSQVEELFKDKRDLKDAVKKYLHSVERE